MQGLEADRLLVASEDDTSNLEEDQPYDFPQKQDNARKRIVTRLGLLAFAGVAVALLASVSAIYVQVRLGDQITERYLCS